MESAKIVKFIDSQNDFAIQFFDGRKLIEDLAIMHNLDAKTFGFFRNIVLAAELLSVLLKEGETLGFYIDSDDPYMRLKIEMAESGKTRLLILPEGIQGDLAKITGKVRLIKFFTNNAKPYTSILDITDQEPDQIVNVILKQSYQLDARIILNSEADQAVFFFKLPKGNVDRKEISDESKIDLDSYIKKNDFLYSNYFSNEKKLIKTCKEKGINYIGEKSILFSCPCSVENMKDGIKTLIRSTSVEHIFEGKSSIETRCDYCKTYYQILKSDFI